MPSYLQCLEAAAAAQLVSGVKNVHNHLAVVLPDDDYRDDAWLTTAANNALTLNVTVPDGVEATARDGNLTLTGLAGFGRQREAAELAVAGLTGVRSVKDEIEITYDADPVDVTGLVQDALDRNAAGLQHARLPDRELLAPAHPRRDRLYPAPAAPGRRRQSPRPCSPARRSHNTGRLHFGKRIMPNGPWCLRTVRISLRCRPKADGIDRRLAPIAR